MILRCSVFMIFTAISMFSILSISTAQELDQVTNTEKQRLEAQKRFNEALKKKAQIEDERFRIENNKSGPSHTWRKFLKGLGYTVLAIAAGYGIYQLVDNDGDSSRCDDEAVNRAVNTYWDCRSPCDTALSDNEFSRTSCIEECAYEPPSGVFVRRFLVDCGSCDSFFDLYDNPSIKALKYTCSSSCSECKYSCNRQNPTYPAQVAFETCANRCLTDRTNSCLDEAKRRGLL